MGNRLIWFLLATLALTFSGCGTALNFMHGKGNTPAPREIYGGLKTDAYLTSGFVEQAFYPSFRQGETPGDKVTQAIFGIPFYLSSACLAILDMPFSAVADTVTLPITIPASIHRDVLDFHDESARSGNQESSLPSAPSKP